MPTDRDRCFSRGSEEVVPALARCPQGRPLSGLLSVRLASLLRLVASWVQEGCRVSSPQSGTRVQGKRRARQGRPHGSPFHGKSQRFVRHPL